MRQGRKGRGRSPKLRGTVLAADDWMTAQCAQGVQLRCVFTHIAMKAAPDISI
jgi:hypothetical protein